MAIEKSRMSPEEAENARLVGLYDQILQIRHDEALRARMIPPSMPKGKAAKDAETTNVIVPDLTRPRTASNEFEFGS